MVFPFYWLQRQKQHDVLPESEWTCVRLNQQPGNDQQSSVEPDPCSWWLCHGAASGAGAAWAAEAAASAAGEAGVQRKGGMEVGVDCLCYHWFILSNFVPYLLIWFLYFMVILKRVAITNENLGAESLSFHSSKKPSHFIHSYKAKSWDQDGGMKGRPSKILGDREMLHQNQHVTSGLNKWPCPRDLSLSLSLQIAVVFVDKYHEICPIHTQNHGMHMTCSGFSWCAITQRGETWRFPSCLFSGLLSWMKRLLTFMAKVFLNGFGT